MTGSTETTVRTAVVMAADGVRFEASGAATAVADQLAGYVGQRCDHTLWPPDARRVHALLEANLVDEAIALYFARVGERWDDERLELDNDVKLLTARPAFVPHETDSSTATGPRR